MSCPPGSAQKQDRRAAAGEAGRHLTSPCRILHPAPVLNTGAGPPGDVSWVKAEDQREEATGRRRLWSWVRKKSSESWAGLSSAVAAALSSAVHIP